MIDEVIIEYLDGKKVSIYLYDRDTDNLIGGSMEVLDKKEAQEKYNIVGEIFEGEIMLYDRDHYEEEDFSDISDLDEDD